jgi:hypothetical protein
MPLQDSTSREQRHHRSGRVAGETIDPDRTLIFWGWICTFLLAPVGAIIGIILITRNRLGHGLAQLIISVLWLVIALNMAAAAPASAAVGHAKSTRPWLPVRVAQADTLDWESLFADWRIRKATHVPDATYSDLYSPEEAAHWLRELALPSCVRVRRNVVDCTAEMIVWDGRSGEGETATWEMRVRRYRDSRVRDGLVTLSHLRGGDDWSDVTVRPIARRSL